MDSDVVHDGDAINASAQADHRDALLGDEATVADDHPRLKIGATTGGLRGQCSALEPDETWTVRFVQTGFPPGHDATRAGLSVNA